MEHASISCYITTVTLQIPHAILQQIISQAGLALLPIVAAKQEKCAPATPTPTGALGKRRVFHAPKPAPKPYIAPAHLHAGDASSSSSAAVSSPTVSIYDTPRLPLPLVSGNCHC